MTKYLITFIFFAFKSYGALEVTIAQGKVEPTPIAITQVFGEDADTSRYGNTIRQIISNNLTNSGLFYTVNEDLYIQSDNLVEKVKISSSVFLWIGESKESHFTHFFPDIPWDFFLFLP